MYLYFESLGKNLTATMAGLFIFAEGVAPLNPNEKSLAYLILTITVPSVIAGLVTIAIELIKSRKNKE